MCTKNTIHARSKDYVKLVNIGSSDIRHHFWHIISSDACRDYWRERVANVSAQPMGLALGLPTNVGTANGCTRVDLASGVSTYVRTADDQGHHANPSGVPTYVKTTDGCTCVDPGVRSSNLRRDCWRPRPPRKPVGSSDLRWDFRHHQSQTILHAYEVLECLSYDLVLIFKHSIFLRPTKFASLFIVRHSLNSRSNIKEYNHFNHLSLQCLHMSLLLIITS
jgi:hypothetical protein